MPVFSSCCCFRGEAAISERQSRDRGEQEIAATIGVSVLIDCARKSSAICY